VVVMCDEKKEKEVEEFLKELDKQNLDNKEKINKIFEEFTNGRQKMALERLKKQIESDIKKYRKPL